MKNKKGFTLVELLAVIVILAILATAAFTLVLPQIEKSRKKSFVNEVSNILESAELYFLENPTAKNVTIEGLKTYIKNYDSSKKGCVCIVYKDNDITKDVIGYSIRFSNGDYKTKGVGYWTMEALKEASGAATNAVVKIDSSNSDFTFTSASPACPGSTTACTAPTTTAPTS